MSGWVRQGSGAMTLSDAVMEWVRVSCEEK